MKIGILKEHKQVDDRVPLSPTQCREIMDNYPEIHIVIQKSTSRRFKNKEYKEQSITLVDCVENCDILLGVRETPIDQLLPNKTYFFFSHITKSSLKKRDLLEALIMKKITFIDYEYIKSKHGLRLIFSKYFGREFISKVLPHLLNGDKEGVLEKATICKNGELTNSFEYLKSYLIYNDITEIRI